MFEKENFKGFPVYTLTNIAESIHSVISKNYPKPYYIKAEIVKLNFYPHTGHCYPELAEKDKSAIKTQMRAIIWAAQFKEINNRFIEITGETLKDGISILCLAYIKFDVKYGFSLQIQDIEPAYTMGEMLKNRLKVIERLKKEGSFSLNKSLQIPLLLKRIAIISVETSKGYSDFLSALNSNVYKFTFYTKLFPSILQGEKAVQTIITQLDKIFLEKESFDCVALIRGGGGDIGLSCYDEYELVSKIASFPLPLISGIGHSTNETIVDMVSYQSKITPTDAANFIIENFRTFYSQIEACSQTINQYFTSLIRDCKIKLLEINQKKNNRVEKIISHEKNNIILLEQQINTYTYKIFSQQKEYIEKNKQQIKHTSSKTIEKQIEIIKTQSRELSLFSRQTISICKKILSSIDMQIKILDPINIIKRGFTITTLNGKAVKSVFELKTGEEISTKFYDGEIKSKI